MYNVFFCFAFCFLKVISMSTTLGKQHMDRHLLRRQQALVCIYFSLNIHFSGVLNRGRRNWNSHPRDICSLPPHYLCLLFIFQDYEGLKTSSIMQTLSLFLSFILTVSCWAQSKGLDKQLSPWTHINMKISALLSGVNIIPQRLLGVAEPLGSASQFLLCILITHGSY